MIWHKRRISISPTVGVGLIEILRFVLTVHFVLNAYEAEKLLKVII